MKIAGYKPETPNISTVVIPREPPLQDIVFKVQAVLDQGPFDKLCPAPEAPTIVHKDGTKAKNTEDPVFREKLNNYVIKKSAWLFIQSLRATPDLEWEKVDYSNPETWHYYLEELRDFKLTDSEISVIYEAIHDVNGLNEVKMEAARKSFLAGRAVALKE